MILSDLLSFIFSAAASSYPASAPTPDCPGCAGESMTAIAAALATQGYYLQADILDQILIHGLGNWAIFAYVCSVIGGLISMAMGMPYRMYLWFIIGPAVFSWLVSYRTVNPGTEWTVAKFPRDMRQVWKFAEPGLKTTNYVVKNAITFNSDKKPSAGAHVSFMFAYYDRLISDTSQRLIAWFGLSRGIDPNNLSNTNKWDLISNLKWQYLSGITAASIKNTNLRVLFVKFFTSECGEQFMRGLDSRKLVSYASASSIPENASVLKAFWSGGSKPEDELAANCATGTNAALPSLLLQAYVPTPKDELVPLLVNKAGGTEDKFPQESRFADLWESDGIKHPRDYAGAGPIPRVADLEEMRCDNYFTMMMLGLRWEAAHLYYQILRQAPEGVNEDAFVTYLFEGWNVPSSIEDQKEFLQNMILVHLVRNELRFHPFLFKERRYTVGQQVVQNSSDFQREIAGSGKFIEIYNWALMLPYFQGVLLYLLAVAYPFACMMVVVPGFHKIVFQWMQMWAWVKLWDVGFALVMVVEKSVWTTIGGSYGRESIFKFIDTISPFNINNVGPASNPVFADVQIATDSSMNASSLCDLYGKSINLFDKLLVLSSNTDFDLANSYYIYIMAALYFAVPVVIGQCVLGAKSGMASMLSSALGEISRPAGSAAEKAAGEMIGFRGSAFKAVGQQEQYAKSMRSGGLAASILATQNEQTKQNIMSGIASSKEDAARSRSQAIGLGGKRASEVAGAAGTAVGGVADLWAKGASPGNILGALGKTPQAVAQANSARNSQAEMEQNKAGMNARKEQTEANRNASLAGLSASRKEAGADMKAQSLAQGAFGLAFAQNMSGYNAAIGGMGGAYNVSGLPTNMHGMAMQGRLGSEAKAAAEAGSVFGSTQAAIDDYKKSINDESLQKDYDTHGGSFKETVKSLDPNHK